MADAQMKNFEYFTSFLGDYGFFQILMIVLLSLSSVPLGYMAVISVFVADTPEYHCKGSINSTRNDSWIGPDSCSRYKVKKTWAQPPALSNDTEPCLDGWVFSTDIYTSTIVSEVSAQLGASGWVRFDCRCRFILFYFLLPPVLSITVGSGVWRGMEGALFHLCIFSGVSDWIPLKRSPLRQVSADGRLWYKISFCCLCLVRGIYPPRPDDFET